MKKIGLFNIDSKKIPNLALLKVEKFYKEKGYECIWDNKEIIPQCEKIYVSCVFTQNKSECEYFEKLIPKFPNIEINIGGSGYDISKRLPDEIDEIKIYRNFGFTSRGCIRNCGFCIVPKKEGKFKPVGDIYDLWDGKSNEIVLMDNNIFSDVEHFRKIANQLIENNLKVDFNQGLDIRLLTDEIAEILKQLKPISTWKFSFDDMRYSKPFIRGAEILKKYRLLTKCQIFVLVGFNTTPSEDMLRLEIINRYKLNVFFMLYEKGKNLKGELTEEELDIFKKVRSPIGNKGKYLRILNLNNSGNEKIEEKKVIKNKPLF